jgi:hypothetical protein
VISLPDLGTISGSHGGSAEKIPAEPLSIASPLPYLFAEERHGDRQAREALFCTFNADLGFFERTVLGVTQATSLGLSPEWLRRRVVCIRSAFGLGG